MTKEIGIVEINYHSQNTYYLCKILKRKYDITLFIDSEIYERLKTFPESEFLEDVHMVVRKDSESKQGFLSKVKNVSEESLDFLLFGTVTGTAPELFRFARCSIDLPTAMYIYKVYNWMAPKIYFDRSIRNTIRENLRNLARQYVISKQNYLLSEYQTGSKLISEIRGDVNVQMLRPLFRSDWTIGGSVRNEDLRIVIPGSIKQGRGIEYKNLLSISEKIPNGVVIELLGRPMDEYGRRVIEEAAQKAQFEIHDSWIPHADFAATIESADALFGPFSRDNMTWKTGSRTERRSVSVGSGITLDAVKYSTPLILPKYYTHDPELDSGVKTYGSFEDIPRLTEKLISDESDTLTRMKSGMDSVSEKYTLSTQRDRFESFVDGMID